MVLFITGFIKNVTPSLPLWPYFGAPKILFGVKGLRIVRLHWLIIDVLVCHLEVFNLARVSTLYLHAPVPALYMHKLLVAVTLCILCVVSF